MATLKQPILDSRREAHQNSGNFLIALLQIITTVLFVALTLLTLKYFPGGAEPLTLGRRDIVVLETAVALQFLLLLAYRYVRHQSQQHEHASLSDPLTGLSSRLHFELLLEDEMHRAVRYRYPLSVCILDVDSFASYNENFGQKQADEMLKNFAKFLDANVRVSDTVGRFEEDSFAVFLPHTDLVQSQKFISRILMLSQERLDLSFSAGVTSHHPSETRTEFLVRAGLALKNAKREGKKRVCGVISGQDSTTIVNF